MNQNGLGNKSNFIPEVFAGANNKRNEDLQKHLNKSIRHNNLKLIISTLVRTKVMDKLIY